MAIKPCDHCLKQIVITANTACLYLLSLFFKQRCTKDLNLERMINMLLLCQKCKECTQLWLQYIAIYCNCDIIAKNHAIRWLQQYIIANIELLPSPTRETSNLWKTGWCTAQCKMLPFCAKTIVKESGNFELASLTFWFSTFAMIFRTTGCVVRHENTQRWTVHCYNGL